MSSVSEPTNFKFNIDDIVLCFYKPLMYKAKILRRREVCEGIEYFLHYIKWKNTYNGWMPEDSLFELNAENLLKMEELKQEQANLKKKRNNVKKGPQNIVSKDNERIKKKKGRKTQGQKPENEGSIAPTRDVINRNYPLLNVILNDTAKKLNDVEHNETETTNEVMEQVNTNTDGVLKLPPTFCPPETRLGGVVGGRPLTSSIQLLSAEEINELAVNGKDQKEFEIGKDDVVQQVNEHTKTSKKRLRAFVEGLKLGNTINLVSDDETDEVFGDAPERNNMEEPTLEEVENKVEVKDKVRKIVNWPKSITRSNERPAERVGGVARGIMRNNEPSTVMSRKRNAFRIHRRANGCVCDRMPIHFCAATHRIRRRDVVKKRGVQRIITLNSDGESDEYVDDSSSAIVQNNVALRPYYGGCHSGCRKRNVPSVINLNFGCNCAQLFF